MQKVGTLHLRATVKDVRLRRALTPDYTLGCKRLLLSNTYYPALTRPNVTVHVTAVEAIGGSRVVGADGSGAAVDTIILGTGFHILDMPVARRVFDADGASLDDHWKGSPDAYLGTTVSGFPNAFALLGPHLGTGHSSAFMVLEAQLAYLRRAVRHFRSAGWTAMDVRPEVQAAFNAEVQQALPPTVYNAGGCAGYYLDSNGINSFSWPWSTGRMRRRLADFDPEAYEFHGAAADPTRHPPRPPDAPLRNPDPNRLRLAGPVPLHSHRGPGLHVRHHRPEPRRTPPPTSDLSARSPPAAPRPFRRARRPRHRPVPRRTDHKDPPRGRRQLSPPGGDYDLAISCRSWWVKRRRRSNVSRNSARRSSLPSVGRVPQTRRARASARSTVSLEQSR